MGLGEHSLNSGKEGKPWCAVGANISLLESPKALGRMEGTAPGWVREHCAEQTDTFISRETNKSREEPSEKKKAEV